jgi:hypothetical protein
MQHKLMKKQKILKSQSINFFTDTEVKMLKSFRTPAQVQDFLNTIPINFEFDGKDTVKSPLQVLRTNSAHCIEGALLGAYILSLQGHKPLIVHLEAPHDFDHVIAIYKQNGYLGALSKTNHAALRYREPVYKTLRELVLSYFHEYFTDDGIKTLRRYSRPLNLNTFQSDWMTLSEDLWGIDEELDKIRHFDIAPKINLKKLRNADQTEREAGKITEWKKKNNSKNK